MTDRNAAPGARLRAERERLGVTVREVSETLNLTMGVVHAIEADDYGRLPGPVFTRGYLRAYARLLRIDPEPLLNGCPYAARDVSPAPERSEPALREWVRRRPVLVLGGAGVIAAAVLIAGLLLLWPEPGAQTASGGSQGAAARGVANADAAVPAAVAEADLPVAGAGAAGAPTSPSPAPADYLASSISGVTDDADAAAPVAQQGGPAEAAPTGGLLVDAGVDGGQRITAQGDDRLGMDFSEDCWVEVRDPEGRNLYSNLSRGGSELTLVGQGPFRVLLGYAPGASLRFNGEPVPLEPHTRNNVASLVLGH